MSLAQSSSRATQLCVANRVPPIAVPQAERYSYVLNLLLLLGLYGAAMARCAIDEMPLGIWFKRPILASCWLIEKCINAISRAALLGRLTSLEKSSSIWQYVQLTPRARLYPRFMMSNKRAAGVFLKNASWMFLNTCPAGSCSCPAICP